MQGLKLWDNQCNCNFRCYLVEHANIHSSITHNSSKVETAQMSISWWINKQNATYPYNGIIFGNENEWCGTGRCSNMEEPWKYNAKWKPTPKDSTVWFYLYERYRISQAVKTERRLLVSRGWREGELRTNCYWYRVSFRAGKNVLKLDCGDGCTTLWI